MPVDGGVLELARLSVREELLPCGLDGNRLFLFLDRQLSGGFPIADSVLRLFPVPCAQRFANLSSSDEAVGPERAAAATILAAFEIRDVLHAGAIDDERGLAEIGHGRPEVFAVLANDLGAAIGGDFWLSGHDRLGEFTPAEVGCREF